MNQQKLAIVGVGLDIIVTMVFIISGASVFAVISGGAAFIVALIGYYWNQVERFQLSLSIQKPHITLERKIELNEKYGKEQ